MGGSKGFKGLLRGHIGALGDIWGGEVTDLGADVVPADPGAESGFEGADAVWIEVAAWGLNRVADSQTLRQSESRTVRHSDSLTLRQSFVGRHSDSQSDSHL